MVRITNKSIIIEIPSDNETAMTTLHFMQDALMSIPALIDYRNDPNLYELALFYCSRLSREMMIDERQMEEIGSLLFKNQKLLEDFNQ